MEYLFYSDFSAFEPFLGPKNAFSTLLRKFLDQMIMFIAFAFKFPIISAISRLITRSTVRVLVIRYKSHEPARGSWIFVTKRKILEFR